MEQDGRHEDSVVRLRFPPPSGSRTTLDLDILIAFAICSPIFLAVVIGTVARRESFGPEPTACAALVGLTLAMAVSALRARR
jgi:hypothetical protein